MRFVLAAVFVLSACSSKKAADVPSCEKIVDNMLTITKAAMPAHGDMELGNKKQMAAECEKRGLSDEQKRCMATAKDLNGLAACTPKPAVPK
ncbi:MAG: hypothetical protein ACKV2T_13825 [Kofleriaceae bacterium]